MVNTAGSSDLEPTQLPTTLPAVWFQRLSFTRTPVAQHFQHQQLKSDRSSFEQEPQAQVFMLQRISLAVGADLSPEPAQQTSV
jgi:hypothetical protein